MSVSSKRVQPFAALGAGADVAAADAVALAELLQFLLRKGGRAAVHPRADQHGGGQLPLALELLQPELHALERVLPIAGIEQHQRGGDVLQKDGVNLPIDVLTCQIPQHGFALGAVYALQSELRDSPELLAVRGSVLLELAVRQPPAQPRFAHARIADQHNLGRHIVEGTLQSTFVQNHIEVEIPDPPTSWLSPKVASTLLRLG